MVAAINAGMYRADHTTSVGYMRTRTHVNNGRLSRERAILAFDSNEDDLPEVRIIDRDCESLDDYKGSYGSFLQSIRMVSCRGENVWEPNGRRFSTAAIGTDTSGRLLLIHAKSAWTTHDFIEVLMSLPIDLDRAMYAEGGAQAQLYVQAGDFRDEFLGAIEGGLPGIDSSFGAAWPIPNVLGVVRR